MLDIIELQQPDNLPAIDRRERDARNALSVWLGGFRSPNTRRAYEREMRAFAEFTRRGGAEAAAAWLLGLTDSDAHRAVDLWRADKLARGNAPATVNRSMAALNSFVNSARRGGFTTLRLEARGEKSVSYRDTKGPGLPAILKMLAIARNQRNRRKAARDAVIIELAFELGLRRAEISSLNIVDVDLEGGRLMIIGKGRAEKQPLTLSSELRETLGAWLHYRRGDVSEPLFISISKATADGRLSGDGIHHIIADIGDMAGVKARPHGIRHTAITEALNRVGGDFRKVRAFSRHSSLDIIQRYDDAREDSSGKVSALLTALTQ